MKIEKNANQRLKIIEKIHSLHFVLSFGNEFIQVQYSGKKDIQLMQLIFFFKIEKHNIIVIEQKCTYTFEKETHAYIFIKDTKKIVYFWAHTNKTSRQTNYKQQENKKKIKIK